MTRALDIQCPTCGAIPWNQCDYRIVHATGFVERGIHQARINAAVKATRDANRARREAGR